MARQDELAPSHGVDGNQQPEKDAMEMELERLVLGNSAEFKRGLKDIDEDKALDLALALEDLDDEALFTVDRGPADNDLMEIDGEDDEDQERGQAAWDDSDDGRLQVSLASQPRLRKLRRTEAEDFVSGKEYMKRLRKQYEALHPPPKWAQDAMNQPRKRRRLTNDNEAEDDDVVSGADPLSVLLQNSESLVRTSGPGTRRRLQSGAVNVQRAAGVPGVQPSAITSLSFHPTLPLLLSSGPSSTLFLHQIASSPPEPTANPLLTSLHVRNTPLTTTAFHPIDSRIFLSARRRYFHVWDLHSGRVEKITRVYGQQHVQRSMERFKLSPDGLYMALLASSKKGGGEINILSASTLQWIGQVRIEGRGGIADFCWWRNSKGLCIAAKNGEMSEWSVESRSVIVRWQDHGAGGTTTTTITLGGRHNLSGFPLGTDRWVVVGSGSSTGPGVVNIYDREKWARNHQQNTSSPPIPPLPEPQKSLNHITAPPSHLHISPDGQLLAMATRWQRDALRLVHLPSCTVYPNWPTSSTPLGRISSLAFCDGAILPHQDILTLLAIGTESGKIRLWEIRPNS
ncbi:WD40 repeat-like protein [Piedraia hortae CBS 480.64]|uniref:WD40 repeat-like protein n=1 Tax=Piedraia hortae CBS 480.64 TaxID=1314780 RepID=A0A6A7BXP1_9PEZI|nr:WD40 repeat-like protein [Piedraia hortae CBS 480.64]